MELILIFVVNQIRITMKKAIFIIFCFFIISCSIQNSAIKQANILTNAMKTRKYEVTAKYTHPNIIEMLGGDKKYLQILAKGGKEMKNMGISYESIELGKPSGTVVAGNELHCLIPETITMKLKEGKMVSKSHLLAVSKDKGKNWTFIEVAMLDDETVKKVLPNYNTELKLPKMEEPNYIKD